jgi:hypothetical protein
MAWRTYLGDMRLSTSLPADEPSQAALWRAALASGRAFLLDAWRELWPIALALGLGVPLCLTLVPAVGLPAAVAALALAGAASGVLAGLVWLHAAGERSFWPAWSGDGRVRKAAAAGMAVLAGGMTIGLGGWRLGASMGGDLGGLTGFLLGTIAWMWALAGLWSAAPRWMRGEPAAPAWDRAWGRVPRLLGCIAPAALPLLPAAALAALLPPLLGGAAAAAGVGASLLLLALVPAAAATAFPSGLGKSAPRNPY